VTVGDQRSPVRRLAVAFLLAALVLLPGARARAASVASEGTATLSNLTVNDDAVSLTVSVAVPAGMALDPARTEVSVGGQLLESHVTAAATTSSTSRVAMLVVDTSGSMGTAGISAVRVAAMAYLLRVAPDVKVGLIGFSDRARLITAPTLDRGALQAGLSQLHSKGETALYDAVQAALPLAGRGGAVVVLSDGADTVSRADLPDLLARVSASGARVSTVAFHTQDGVRGPLEQLARTGGGRLVTTSAASDLAAAFAQAAAALPAQLSLTALLPDKLPAGRALLVRVGTGTTSWSASTTLPVAVAGTDAGPVAVATTPLPAPETVSGPQWYASMPVTLGVVFGTVLLLCLLLRPRAKSAATVRGELLSAYSVRTAPLVDHVTVGAQEEPSQLSLVQLSQRLVDRRGTSAGITRELERAGSRLRPGEWVFLRFSTVLAVAAVVTVIAGNALVGVLGGIVFGLLGSHVWLRRRQAHRARAFSDALPDTLQLVSSSLRTGFSLPQALDAAQHDGVEPMSSELGRALAANRIGAPLEDELDRIADRTGSEDWRWAVMAMRIQRAVGGNLSEVLLTTVRTLRERASTRRLIRSLSAEGRLSAYILLGLPIGVALLLFTFRRTYVRPLWTTTPGIVMVSVAAALMCVGTWWMRNVVRLEE
jgi:tight adherence protein B